MYTSGWPKVQNRCRQRSASPAPTSNEVCVNEPIENQRRAGEHHRGHGEEHHEGGDELSPDEHGIRFSVRPVVRILNAVVTTRPPPTSDADLGERDEPRPHVRAFAGVYKQLRPAAGYGNHPTSGLR